MEFSGNGLHILTIDTDGLSWSMDVLTGIQFQFDSAHPGAAIRMGGFCNCWDHAA